MDSASLRTGERKLSARRWARAWTPMSFGLGAATSMGVKQSAYAQLERRKGAMRHAARQRLAQAFGVEPEPLRME